MAVMGERDPRELVADVERLLEELETLADATGRQTATDVVQALLELYGAGLARIVDEIAARDDGDLAQALADDELVAHLLLLHGLHPVPVQARVLSALGEVRPYLESHGGNVELLEVEPPVVRLRLQGSCSGCPSSAMTLKLAIENAIFKAAPEIENVEAVDEAPAPSPLLQIEMTPGVGSTHPAAPAEPEGSWTMAGGLPDLEPGRSLVREIAGQPILFLAVGENLYAYRPRCPGCDGSLAEAVVRGAELTCPGCGIRYDPLRAGRCLDSPQLHLEPVPLLVGEDGLVKVALLVAA
ncbi:MAG TPA: NifU family protein [Solirubrobacteraceae bacterium]|nr:NifU family protein [Solirubrobacteraceae bacterium]